MSNVLILFPEATYRRTGECDGCGGKAPCCTYVKLPLARELTSDEVCWVELHPGLKVEGQSVRIDVACSALVGGKCALYGEPERPEMCGRYPEVAGLDEGCAYKFERVTLKEE